ncbi:hypothetical protein [Dickeya oryzae]
MHTWQFWVLIASFVLVSASGLTFISNSIKFASAFHFSLTAGTVITVGMAITSGLSRVVGGWIADKIGIDKTMTIFLYPVRAFFRLLRYSWRKQAVQQDLSAVALYRYSSGGHYIHCLRQSWGITTVKSLPAPTTACCMPPRRE